MNAGTSWSLMGLTLRLAMSLGLHRSCPPAADIETKAIRSKVWWSIVWQDSLLSITYDRAATTAYIDPSSMPAPDAYTQIPPYHLAMYRLCSVGLEIVRDRTKTMSSRELFARITNHRNEIDDIMAGTADYLRDSRTCKSVEESLEHWALYLHVSYIVSELCRPAISPSTASYELSKAFKQTCIDSLVSTVEAFLGLQNITPYARQSWAAVHRSLSSALLLGIMGEHAHNEDIAMGGASAQSVTDSSDSPGMAGGDHSSVFPSNTSALVDEEYSPYSVLNSILWGQGTTP